MSAPARIPAESRTPAALQRARLPQPQDNARVQAIDALLPQTQCGQCGYAGCLPYARALAQGSTLPNRCPPGGTAGMEALSALLQVPPLPLDPACGAPRPLHVARIDESLCIGCTLCIQACPVDAIVGAVKRMHTVLAGRCTGCDLCLPPCPMDCIQMLPVLPARPWTTLDAGRAREQLRARAERLAREQARNEARLVDQAQHALTELAARDDLAQEELARRTAIVERALARARERRATRAARAPAPATAPGAAARETPA